MKRLQSKILAVSKAESAFHSACEAATIELYKFLDFEHDARFYVEYQASDGVVLGDDNSNIYHMGMILSHIDEHGKIKSFEELKKFSI